MWRQRQTSPVRRAGEARPTGRCVVELVQAFTYEPFMIGSCALRVLCLAWPMLAGCLPDARQPALPNAKTALEPATEPARKAASVALPRRLTVEGLPNAVQLHPRVISGGQPEGEMGFRALRDLGIKTVISVDGALPEVELARQQGLRYVHIPHGYDGIPRRRGLELAKAVRELEGPIYIHCHHGKHRSPAAAAVACVAAGLVDADAARALLVVAGTSPSYRGLYQSVEQAQRLDDALLAQLAVEYTERAALPELAAAMVALEQTHDRLKVAAQSGWARPAEHPDIDPSHEALLLREHFTEMLRQEEAASRPVRFQDLLRDGEAAALELEQVLRGAGEVSSGRARAKQADRLLKRVTQSCAACHRQFRDVPLSEEPAG